MSTKHTIKCPACYNSLTKIKAGKITVDACKNGCGGIWFDKNEITAVDEHHETIGNTLLNIQTKPDLNIDYSKTRVCPVCNVNMQKIPLTLVHKFEIDECYSCDGIWLDGKELMLLRDHNKQIGGAMPSKGSSQSFTDSLHSKLVDFFDSII